MASTNINTNSMIIVSSKMSGNILIKYNKAFFKDLIDYPGIYESLGDSRNVDEYESFSNNCKLLGISSNYHNVILVATIKNSDSQYFINSVDNIAIQSIVCSVVDENPSNSNEQIDQGTSIKGNDNLYTPKTSQWFNISSRITKTLVTQNKTKQNIVLYYNDTVNNSFNTRVDITPGSVQLGIQNPSSPTYKVQFSGDPDVTELPNDGAVIETNSSIYVIPNDVPKKQNPPQGTYTFADWKHGDDIFSIGDSVTLNTTNIYDLFAEFHFDENQITEQIILTIKYDTLGGEEVLPKIYYCDVQNSESTKIIKLAAKPSKEGFKFLGWKCELDDVVYPALSNYTVTYLNEDITILFTAEWKEQDEPDTPQGSGIIINLNAGDLADKIVVTNSTYCIHDRHYDTIYSVPISKPMISVITDVELVDSADENQDKKPYSYYSTIYDNNGSKTYYGVKRDAFFSVNEDYNAVEKENINAQVVKLIQETTQQQIYSFKNGAQYTELNNNSLKKQRLLPHYIHSYEYKIDGEIPNDQTNINLTFYGSNGEFSTQSTQAIKLNIDQIYNSLNRSLSEDNVIGDSTRLVKDYLSYSFKVNYTISGEENEIVFSEIQKSPNIKKIQENIDDASSDSNIYEEKYNISSREIREAYQKYSQYIDIYEKKISYIGLSKELFNNSDLTNNINAFNSNGNDLPEMQNVFYVYDDKAKIYIPVTSNEKTDYSQYQFFAKSISYTKISSDSFNDIDQETSLINSDRNASQQNIDWTSIKYVKEYEYTPIDKTKSPSKTQYFIKIKNEINDLDIYAPIQPGIVNDGSIEYYSYTYVELTEDRLKKIKEENNDEVKIYVKQDYKHIYSSELKDSDYNNIFKKKGDSVVYAKSLTSSDYIFDLDIEGTTIYANSRGEAIDKDVIENLYYTKQNDPESWINKYVEEETVTNKIYKYSLPTNYNICKTLNYEGEWEKIDLNKLKDNGVSISQYINSLSDEDKLFIGEEGYNEISKSEIALGYGIKYYIYEIGKISSVNINKIIKSNNSDIYIDVEKYGFSYDDTEVPNDELRSLTNAPKLILKKIDNYGYIADDEIIYYDRDCEKIKSYDLYYFIDKNYFTEINSNDIQAQLQSIQIPLALLSINIDNVEKKFSNLFKTALQINNEDTEYYLKVTNNFAKFLFDNNAQDILYVFDELSESLHSQAQQYLEGETYYIDIFNISNSNIEINKEIDDSENISSNISYSILGIDLPETFTFYEPLDFYKTQISHYILSDETHVLSEILEYDNKFLYSKYFYPNFTINNGIHVASDGSYYTSIMVFDGTRGSISKNLALVPNIFNITEYSYMYDSYAYIEVPLDEDLSEITKNHYNEYYIKEGNEYKQLSKESKPLTYYQNWFNNRLDDSHLYQYKSKEFKVKYDGSTINFEDYSQVQYFDNTTYMPKIIKKNNELFGIIFKEPKIEDIENATNQQIDDLVVWPASKLMTSPMYDINPLYSYDYSIVELLERTYENINNFGEFGGSNIQNVTIETFEIKKPASTFLANEIAYIFDGTYSWQPPKYETKIVQKADRDNTYCSKKIMAYNGYWYKNYTYDVVPLKIASYNFYTNTGEISNTTASYNYIPLSYVIIASIQHPKISYLTRKTQNLEISRFTYKDDSGIEKNYLSTDPVEIGEDGKYYGIGKVGVGSSIQEKVELIQHIDIDTSTIVEEIEHQKESVSYEYFTYKTAIALTNETKPILYNTELIPASTHKVIYWNEDANSYAIKTVVDSYAYYSYNYMNEVVPFEVKAYIVNPFTISGDGNVYYKSITKEELDDSAYLIGTYISKSNSLISNSLDNLVSYISDNQYFNNNINLTTYIVSGFESINQTLSNTYVSISEAISSLKDNEDSNESELNGDGLEDITNKLALISRSISYTNESTQALSSTINEAISTLKNAIDKLEVSRRQPTYEEFMLEMTKTLYAKNDFESDIIETEQRDENGNLISSNSHKPNPINFAKKAIYRSEILWNELKKKNIVN